MQGFLILAILGFLYISPVICQHATCKQSYYKLGCFQDRRWSRSMSELLITDRENVRSPVKIDWDNWDHYLHGLACRCAQAASSRGYTTFGLQYYGECWSGPDACDHYSRHGESEHCISNNYTTCDINSDNDCVGEENANFVYLLLEDIQEEEPSEIK